MRTVLVAAALLAISTAATEAVAQTVYPIDRADILAGSRFDLKVEFAGPADPAKVSVTLNDKDHAQVFGKTADFVAREDGKDQSALILRDVSLAQPGIYKVRVTDGAQTRELSGTSTTRGRARRRTSFCSSATACRSRTGSRPACSRRAWPKARRAASSRSTTCRTWRGATAGSDSIITDSGQFGERLRDRT